MYLEESGTLDNRLSSQVCDHALRASFADRLAEIEKESWDCWFADFEQESGINSRMRKGIMVSEVDLIRGVAFRCQGS